MAQSAIETNRLSRVFEEPRRLFQRGERARTVALSEVTIRVEPSECAALIGPNGAGKSTLLRVLATIITPTSGTATVAGHDITIQPGEVRRVTGLSTGDHRSFFWPLTGLENLVFFGQLAGISRGPAVERALKLLERVDLSGAADRRVSGYSSGMRKRLDLARALLHDPEVVLLDEPTANLDVEQRARVLRLIERLSRESGKAVLVATHDAGLVAACADRVFRVEQGTVEEQPVRFESRRYRLVVAGLSREVLASLGEVGDGAGDTLTLKVHDLGDGHALAAAVQAVIAEGGEVRELDSAGRLEAAR